MNDTMVTAADLLLHLGLAPILQQNNEQIELRAQVGPVVATAAFEPDRLDRIAWVTIRGKGAQTRTVFPTKKRGDLPKAIARAMLATMLDLAALSEADAELDRLIPLSD